jgi:hypothetical protein
MKLTATVQISDIIPIALILLLFTPSTISQPCRNIENLIHQLVVFD